MVRYTIEAEKGPPPLVSALFLDQDSLLGPSFVRSVASQDEMASTDAPFWWRVWPATMMRSIELDQGLGPGTSTRDNGTLTHPHRSPPALCSISPLPLPPPPPPSTSTAPTFSPTLVPGRLYRWLPTVPANSQQPLCLCLCLCRTFGGPLRDRFDVLEILEILPVDQLVPVSSLSVTRDTFTKELTMVA